MGALIARKYPTTLFAKAADHTYVECGSSGKAWGCWGGKTGGTSFNKGLGSTARADAIASPNERAGITTYLVNGVCHQAANRVLFPARILVVGARGYSISSAIFGAYGKVSAMGSLAPFNQHPGVTGDLPECLQGGTSAVPSKALGSSGKAAVVTSRRMLNLYDKTVHASDDLSQWIANVDAFIMEAKILFKDSLSVKGVEGLRQAKVHADSEHQRLCNELQNNTLDPVPFVVAFNEMTTRFQDDAANALSKMQYRKLFQLDQSERIYLPDPAIINQVFGDGTAEAVYGAELQSARTPRSQ